MTRMLRRHEFSQIFLLRLTAGMKLIPLFQKVPAGQGGVGNGTRMARMLRRHGFPQIFLLRFSDRSEAAPLSFGEGLGVRFEKMWGYNSGVRTYFPRLK